MTDFTDINGKTITPGCTVVVATYRGGLRRGTVYSTKLGRRSWNRDRPSIQLRDENRLYIGTYHKPKSMIVVG